MFTPLSAAAYAFVAESPGHVGPTSGRVTRPAKETLVHRIAGQETEFTRCRNTESNARIV